MKIFYRQRGNMELDSRCEVRARCIDLRFINIKKTG